MKLYNKNYQVNWYPKDDYTFRYVVIDNLFSNWFRKKLLRYMNKSMRKKMFVPFPNYDCDVMTIRPNLYFNPFNFVYSLEWKEFISNMFPDLKLSNNVMAELHHHNINTSDGWIHNDFDGAHFKNEPLKNGLNVWYKNCKYRDVMKRDGLISDNRAIAIIYHLNDKQDWKEGDGGETGFYDDNSSNIDDYIIKVNPIPNRLLVYEINPWSFHSFISNKKHERSTIMMWYHMNQNETKNIYPGYDVYDNNKSIIKYE